MKSKTPLPTTHPIYFNCIYGIHFVTLGLTFSSHLSLLAFTFSQCLSLPLSSLTFLYPISYHFNSSPTITKVHNCIIVFYCLNIFCLFYFGLCHLIHLYIIKCDIILQVKPFGQAGSLYIQVVHCIFKLNMLYIT